MGDAAHGGPQRHTVFNKPFPVRPEIELWDTPRNYKSRRLATDPEVPDKIKVWRVQKSGKTYGGVVSRLYGYEDSPDAEIIAAGFNGGKELGAVGIGRHGNFLQWGFSMAPSKMTDPGKKLFINCICYIKKFKGKGPLIRRRSSHRKNALRLAPLINRIDDKNFFSSVFSEELQKKYGNDPEGLVNYYKENLELVYRDGGFRVDRELESLGIDSNRKLDTLERLIELLRDDSKAAKARGLLLRYTSETFETRAEWREWFEKNRARMFFSDVGGYKFFVVPEGYLDAEFASRRLRV